MKSIFIPFSAINQEIMNVAHNLQRQVTYEDDAHGDIKTGIKFLIKTSQDFIILSKLESIAAQYSCSSYWWYQNKLKR